MKKVQCLLVEKSADDVAVLKGYVSEIPHFLPPIVCQTANEAMLLLHQYAIDVIFLNLSSSDSSGLDLLHSFTKPLPVVVTATGPEFAVDSFDLDVADYLIKPFAYSRFLRSLNRVLNDHFSLPKGSPDDGYAGSSTGLSLGISNDEERDPHEKHGLINGHSIYLKAGYKLRRFQYDDIDYVEAFGTCVRIFTQQKGISVKEIISNMETRLPKQQFIRIHKSYLINLDKISTYTFPAVWIGPSKIPIGAVYRDRIKEALQIGMK